MPRGSQVSIDVVLGPDSMTQSRLSLRESCASFAERKATNRVLKLPRLVSILGTLSILVFASNALAQTNRSEIDIDSPGLMIEAIAGWDATTDRSTPIPISLLITNDSDRLIEGHLSLSDPLNGHFVKLGEIVVGPTTTRRFSSIQALPDWYECIATLSHRGKILWRRELALSTGNEFNLNYNFALFIDHGRKLHLPSSASETIANSRSQITIAGEQGRPIRCLTVKPWQIPNHPGPLIVAQAMIFSEEADVGDLNKVQWRAVALWMSQGGTVFVHQESTEIIERLTQVAPLGQEAPVPSGKFLVRRVGLGSIYEYAEPLFPAGGTGTEIKRRIGETVAHLSNNQRITLLESGFHYYGGGRASTNRIMVVVFFVFYALLSGVGALVQFRASQRRIAAYTIVVVVSACVLAGLLGGFLRFSKGELRWMTVTQAGAGGAVQSAKIDIQSAGGRGKRVAVKGHRPDLQVVEGMSRYAYPWYSRRTISRSAFTWQPNLAKTADDVYQVNAAITPWGSRRLKATAFNRDLRRMQFQLKFEPTETNTDNKSNPTNPAIQTPGAFSLKLVNHLPFNITECWLVIGATRISPPKAIPPPQQQVIQLPGAAGLQTIAAPAAQSGLIDVYQMQTLPVLLAGATHEENFAANLRPIINVDDMVRSWRGGWLVAPRLSRLGDATAWVIGRIENSPIMSIDEQRCDFVRGEQFHLFVQEIRPEDMPAASVFLKRDGNTNNTGTAEKNDTNDGSRPN